MSSYKPKINVASPNVHYDAVANCLDVNYDYASSTVRTEADTITVCTQFCMRFLLMIVFALNEL